MKGFPVFILIFFITALYYQFFLFGKIPIPADALVGSYYPWLDYKWGYEVGVPVKNSTIADVYSAFFVWKNLSIDLIKSGHWPLWNIYSLSGTTFLGSFQAAHFFPFNLLLIFPKYLGWGLFIFGQTLIASLGMYLLLGIYVKNPLAKITGSIVFALSGFMSTWVEFGNGVWAAAMLPWIIYGAEKFFQTKKIRFLLIFAFFFVSLYLAGLAQMIVFASALFFFYLFYRLMTRPVSLLETISLVTYWVLAVFISALAILPAIDATNQSIRSFEAYSKSFNFGLTPWYEYIRIMAADFFGNPSTYNEWSKLTYFEHSIFLGTLSLPLILPFFLSRFRDKNITFWVIIFVGSLFLAFDNPITQIIYSVPLPFLTYSSSGRIFFLTSFSAAVLVALAVDRLEMDRFKEAVVKVTAVTVFLTVALIIFLIFGKVPEYKIAIKNLLLPIFLIIFLLVMLIGKGKLNFSKWIVAVIMLVMVFDLGRYFLKFNPFVFENLVFPKTPAIEFLQSQPGLFRIVRTDDKLLPPNSWMYYQISSIEGYDPMALENYARMFNIVNENSYKSRVSRIVVAKKLRENYLDALNTKYILAIKGSDAEKKLLKDYQKIYEDKNTLIFENSDVLNRAYFVSKITPVSGFEEMVKKIDDPKFNPTEEAVVFEGENLNMSTDGKVEITSYSPEKVIIKTETSGNRYLVLADAYEKNWKVYVNGSLSHLQEVNGALRGVKIPGGESNIEFIYWPNSFQLALKISLVALVALVLLTGYSIRRFRF